VKVPLSWLKEYVKWELPTKELAHRLTMAGTEVEGVTVVGGSWENILIGQVTSLSKHPNADRLKLAKVDLGNEQLTVVCGAPNVAEGQRVPFAKVGSRLVDPRSGELFTLEPARIRGIVSQGMICSERELGISEEQTGIMVLSLEAPIGMPLMEYLGDQVLDLAITPNRPDCLSVIGIAQEVAALTGASVSRPDLSYVEGAKEVGSLASVEIWDSDLCARYCASVVMGVKIGPSPRWMQDRLLRVGMRPINNVVDITNYVMMEYGQPLHAFDYHKLRQQRIIVRRALREEKLLTLDGSERALEPWMLVIADGEGPVALAGLMGGAASEVTEETTAVLLESANFDNLNIRRSTQALRLRSEASLRFEKGLSPELPPMGLRRATQLMLRWAGGDAARGILDVYPGRGERMPLRLTDERIQKVLGVPLPREEVIKVLRSLEFSCETGRSNELLVTPSYWRTDIAMEDDLIEEVARIKGFDQLPTVALSKPLPAVQPAPMLELKDRVRDVLASLGMQEIISYSLTSSSMLEKANAFKEENPPLKVANPMSAEQVYLRTSLRASLLTTLAFNQRRQQEGIRLFELGKVYLPRKGDLPVEREVLAGVISGSRGDTSWTDARGMMDFYDAKGVLEALYSGLGLAAAFLPVEDSLFAPGKEARMEIQEVQVGMMGQVSPEVAPRFDLREEPAFYFEVDLHLLLPLVPEASRRYQPLPRYPAVTRDVALIVDTQVPAARVLEVIRKEPMVHQVDIFDVYTGDQVSSGKKSLAVRLRYISPDRTLTSEEVNQAQGALLERLSQELGAILRQ